MHKLFFFRQIIRHGSEVLVLTYTFIHEECHTVDVCKPMVVCVFQCVYMCNCRQTDKMDLLGFEMLKCDT